MKISEDKLKEGRKLAKDFGFKELYVNVDGEFFTNKSFAAMSVKYDKEQFAEVDLTGTSTGGSTSSPNGSATNASTGSATNDLGKAADVIAAIEVAPEAEVVEAILKAESEGKNRKSVIDAAQKKIAAFTDVARNVPTEPNTKKAE
jgi:hypothetical protein